MGAVSSPAGDTPADRMPLAVQLTRFVITGGLSAIVDFGLLLVGQYALGWDHNAAKAVSWVFGTVTAYAINRTWTSCCGAPPPPPPLDPELSGNVPLAATAISLPSSTDSRLGDINPF